MNECIELLKDKDCGSDQALVDDITKAHDREVSRLLNEIEKLQEEVTENQDYDEFKKR